MSEPSSSLNSTKVRQICLDNGLEIPDNQWQKLEQWASLLLKYNQNINLISRKETHLMWEKQILPCLALLAMRPFPQGLDVCDFGTGGGLPGMILAIVRPDLRLSLVDSRKKKIEVVQQMINDLELENAQTVLGRGEDLGKIRPWRQRFPIITARAVGSLMDLTNWTSGLRKSDSVLHIFKGGEIKEEVLSLTKIIPGVKVNKTLMVLKGYPDFAENKKYLISLNFSSSDSN